MLFSAWRSAWATSFKREVSRNTFASSAVSFGNSSASSARCCGNRFNKGSILSCCSSALDSACRVVLTTRWLCSSDLRSLGNSLPMVSISLPAASQPFAPLRMPVAIFLPSGQKSFSSTSSRSPLISTLG